MSRYIDADALIEACEQWKETVEHDAQDVVWNYGIDACINEIKHHAPTVNAIEVVKCKECKYRMDGNCYVSNFIAGLPCMIRYVGEDNYCSYGIKE